MNFVVIDFETANRHRTSACEIGLVKVTKGQIVDSFGSLIKPHEDFNEFESINMSVHGIKPVDVANSPEINEIWEKVVTFAGELPLIAHNASFDTAVLQKTAALYGLELPALSTYCSLAMSRKSLSLISYSLPWVCEALEIPFQHTHRAVQDSEGAAKVVLKLLERHDVPSLVELARLLDVSPGTLSIDHRIGTKSNRSSPNFESQPTKQSLAEYRQSLSPDEFEFDEDFIGKEVIFTGSLTSMSREDAQKMVIRAGGISGPGVTKKTAILVFGQQDAAALRPGAERSRKFEKALELRAGGQDIEVIDESAFLQLFNN